MTWQKNSKQCKLTKDNIIIIIGNNVKMLYKMNNHLEQNTAFILQARVIIAETV